MKLLQFFEATNPNVKVKKKGAMYTAYLKGRKVGSAVLYDYESDYGMEKNERHIWKSATHPDYTRKGIATELYNVIADDLASRGLKLVPSPDQQLSGDAYQFWKARDPESIKGHGTYKAEKLQHYVGKEIEVRGRPTVVTRVGWAKVHNTPLIGVRFTDVPEGSTNSTGQVRFADVADQLTEDEKISLPDLETGDELMVGKFKNRKATIKGFKKDKNNQPVAKTNKGDQQIFKGRVKKLMDEGQMISSEEAAMLIAQDDELFDAVATYTSWPDVFDDHPEELTKFINILRMIKPFNQRLYRGEMEFEFNNYQPPSDKYTERGFTSWSMSKEVANKWFNERGNIVKHTDGPLQAVSIMDIADARMRSHPGESHYSGGQSEVFVLEPVERKVEGLNESQSFDRTTTEMGPYDDLINATGDERMTDYFRQEKGKEWKMVDISPDEYLDAVDRSFTHGVMDGIEDEKVQRYIRKLKAGETFPALTLDFSRGNYLSQEGRHRSLAAKAVGIKSVPVLVVTATPEEAKYRDIAVPNPEFLKTMKRAPS